MMKTEMYCYLENREKKRLPSRMDEWLDPDRVVREVFDFQTH